MLGLKSADDATVWRAPKNNGYTLVTRDADFQELSLVWGQPPQVIWLKTRNQNRAATLKVSLDNADAVHSALVDDGAPSIDISA